MSVYQRYLFEVFKNGYLFLILCNDERIYEEKKGKKSQNGDK